MNKPKQVRIEDKTESEQEEVQRGENSKDEVEDIRNRLEDIKLASQEHKLSEEELKVNDRLQEEEILALEAIYGENVIVLDREDGLRSFQIYVHVEVSDKFIVSTTMDVEFGGMEIADDNSNGFPYTFKVQHLPQSHSAPFFTISVQWLDAMRISSLCQMLDSIWAGQSGQEIVYSWVDWLHNSSLSYLEFDNGIQLGSFAMAGDRRAISTSVSPDVDIPSILNYNEDRCNDKFCQNLHECSICLSEYAGTKFVILPCKHFFCRNCMETYAAMQAKEIVTMLCPRMECREPVPPGLVKSMLGDEKFEQWESLLFNKTLDSMSDLVYCPRCEMACFEDKDHLAQCPKCLFAFCSLCRGPRHVGAPCKALEEKLIFLQQNPQLLLKMTKQQRKELDLINQFFNEEEIKRTTKQCPNPQCSVAIFRTEGCNHMSCSKCGQEFCYKCGKAYDKGKRHCNNCSFFSHEIIHVEREAMMKQRQAAQQHLERQRQILNQIRTQNPANLPHSCPMCCHMNTKVENNNYIFCWFCQKHYCYLCRKIVGRSSQHYGPKGCKLLSAG
ncbi:hypothetical protein MKW92_011208 [Papaver armeniacum]|nr:hypothetical protein MKW92_011208 [Papaver armeniacum]